MFEVAQTSYVPDASWRSAVRGPISGAFWACSVVGWTLETATSVRTLEGVLSLLSVAPYTLASKYARALECIELARASWAVAPQQAPSGELVRGRTL